MSADLPVKYGLVFNRKTAKALGVDLVSTLRAPPGFFRHHIVQWNKSRAFSKGCDCVYTYFTMRLLGYMDITLSSGVLSFAD
jgi:hypothetical protein